MPTDFTFRRTTRNSGRRLRDRNALSQNKTDSPKRNLSPPNKKPCLLKITENNNPDFRDAAKIVRTLRMYQLSDLATSLKIKSVATGRDNLIQQVIAHMRQNWSQGMYRRLKQLKMRQTVEAKKPKKKIVNVQPSGTPSIPEKSLVTSSIILETVARPLTFTTCAPSTSTPKTVPTGPLQVPRVQKTNIRFAQLPFYDVTFTLLEPTRLRVLPAVQQRNNFVFALLPEQWNQMGTLDSKTEVLLRFCQFNLAREQQDDFPPFCEVFLNNKRVELPKLLPSIKFGVEPKRTSLPVLVTNYCSPVQPQKLSVFWLERRPASQCTWALGVFLVRKLDSKILLDRLCQRPRISEETSRRMIEQYWSTNSDDIATASLRVSLLCPVGKVRMKYPCRTFYCRHLQCFDGDTFLRMNEKKPTWLCPVCDRRTSFKYLAIDEYYSKVLNEAAESVREVQLRQNGQWKVLTVEESDDDESLDENGQNLLPQPSHSHISDRSKIPEVSSDPEDNMPRLDRFSPPVVPPRELPRPRPLFMQRCVPPTVIPVVNPRPRPAPLQPVRRFLNVPTIVAASVMLHNNRLYFTRPPASTAPANAIRRAQINNPSPAPPFLAELNLRPAETVTVADESAVANDHSPTLSSVSSSVLPQRNPTVTVATLK